MKIKTGIAAYGLSGEVFHAPFVQAHPGFEWVAIVERHPCGVAERYPHVRSVSSFDALLREDVELVVVNTPDATHFDFCRKALEAGKHVIVEKPFVTTYAEAETLMALAQRKGLMLMVYQNRRWDGDFLTVRKLLQQQTLGRVVEFHSCFQRYRPHLAQSPWKEDPGRARVGITYNLCSHLCDQAIALFGKPIGVWATLGSLRDNSRIDDYSFIHLSYPDLKVFLRASMLVREEAPRFALHGTAGSYVKYGLDPQEHALRYEGAVPSEEIWCKEDESAWGILHTDQGRRIHPTRTGNYMEFYEHVRQVIREGALPLITYEQMKTDMQILEAVFESDRTGAMVML